MFSQTFNSTRLLSYLLLNFEQYYMNNPDSAMEILARSAFLQW
jgi:hypothetical protein